MRVYPCPVSLAYLDPVLVIFTNEDIERVLAVVDRKNTMVVAPMDEFFRLGPSVAETRANGTVAMIFSLEQVLFQVISEVLRLPWRKRACERPSSSISSG